MGQTLLQPGAKMGSLNSLTGSELLHLAFIVTPSAFNKQIFSTSEHSSISQIGVNFPQTAQPASSNTSEEVSFQKSDPIFWHNSADGSGSNFTSSLDKQCFCDNLLWDSWYSDFEEWHLWYSAHFSLFFFDTMFVYVQHWKILWAWIQQEDLHKFHICDLQAIFVHFIVEFVKAHSFSVLNVNFEARILRGTWHSTSPSLRTRLCFQIFFWHHEELILQLIQVSWFIWKKFIRWKQKCFSNTMKLRFIF